MSKPPTDAYLRQQVTINAVLGGSTVHDLSATLLAEREMVRRLLAQTTHSGCPYCYDSEPCGMADLIKQSKQW